MKMKILAGCLTCLFLVCCTTIGPKNMYTTDLSTGDVVVPVRYVGGLDSLNKKVNGNLFITNSSTKFISGAATVLFSFPTGSISGVYLGNDVRLHFGKTLARWLLIGPFALFIKDKSEVLAIEFTETEKNLVFNPIFQIKVGTGATLKKNIQVKQRFAAIKTHWETALSTDTASSYEKFLKQHPDSERTNEARSRLKELSVERDWKNAQASDSIPAYEEFLKQHPDSEHINEARSRLKELNVERDWKNAQASDSIPAYEEFLKRHSDSGHINEARSRLKEHSVERDWKNAQTSDSIPAYEEFLKQHPDSELANEARSRLNTTKKEQSDWDQAQRADTIQDYNLFIARNPRSRYVEKARAKISEQEAGKVKRGIAGPAKKEEVTAKTKALKRDVSITKFKSSMPTPRMAVVSASVKEKIYVFGGFTRQGRSTSIVEEFDSTTDKWTQKAPMPTSRGMASAVSLGKTVYVVGGRNENGITTAVEIYDTENNSWRKAKSLPVSRWNHMTAAFGGKIYVIGGITGVGNDRKCIASLDIYDPTTESWSAGRSLPEPKQGSAVAEVKGKIYVMGGRTGAGDSGYATSSVAVYDPFKNSWSSAKSMGAARTSARSVVVDDKIYVVGGASHDNATTSIDVYDPAVDKWTTGYHLQEPRSGHSADSIGNKIYIIGGATASSLSAITGTVEEMTLILVTDESISTEKSATAAAQVTGGSQGEAPPDVVILQDHPTATLISKVLPYGQEKLLTLSDPKVEGNTIKMSCKWEKENAEQKNLKGIAFIRGANLVPGASVSLYLHKGWNYTVSQNEMRLTISHDLHGTARIAIFFVNEEDMSPKDIKGVVTYKALSNVVFVDFTF